MTGATSIMSPSRSVSRRAAAAGVISRASTSMLPMVWIEMTIATATMTYSTRSSANTGSPVERAISRSRVTATNSLCSRKATSSRIAPVTATMTTSSSGMPVMDPKRNCCSDPA